ncbi:MAG: type II secretion system inner membrane protein GspF [Deltaproteobacteria bacterium]|nr:type II secretion system inner membrane protein GspF [Deltaproteobacteria bacterium]
MPIYEYKALAPNGKERKGTLDADSLRAARQKLRSQSLFPTELKEGTDAEKAKSRDIKQYFRTDRVSTKDLAVATRQLATLVAAGLPLVSALQALADQTESFTLKRIIIDVREKVEQGSSLAKALAAFPKTFPPLYMNMVASGEASGMLDTVLQNLAEYLEAQLELKRKIFSALMYPILMLSICTLVVLGLFMYVVPRIVEIFKKQGAELPLPTRIMIGISDFLINYWYLAALAIFGALALLRWYYRQPTGRSKIDRLYLKLPIYGPLYTKIGTARISRTLGTLLGSGVGLLNGIDITKNIVSNVHMVKALEDARDGVREGRSLARELGRSGLFPTMLGHMIAVGEASGELEGMLDKAGRAYESEVNATLSGLTSLLEPLMMIFVGTIVLCIVISVLLPMADLITVVQK